VIFPFYEPRSKVILLAARRQLAPRSLCDISAITILIWVLYF